MEHRLLSEDVRDSFHEGLRRLRTEAGNLDALSAGPQPDAATHLLQGFLRWHDDVEAFLLRHVQDPPDLASSGRYRWLLEGTVPPDQMYRAVNGERQRIMLQLSAIEQQLPSGPAQPVTEPAGAGPRVVAGDAAPLVFISHASEDKARFVVPFATQLRANGVNAWLDRWEMLPGDSLVDRIFAEGIGRARAVLFVVSKHSAGSRWVAQELNAATVGRIEGTARVMVVRLDGAEVPPPLRDLVYEDVDPDGDWSPALERIIRAVFEVPARPPLGQPPAYVRHALGVGGEPGGDPDPGLVTTAAEATGEQTTVPATVALIKLGVTDSTHRIRMEESLKALTDDCIRRISRIRLPPRGRLEDAARPGVLEDCMTAFDAETDGLARALATGIYHGEVQHDAYWVRPIVRMCRSTTADGYRYPALRLYYAAGIAAVAAARERFLTVLMRTGSFESQGPVPEELWAFLYPRAVLDYRLADRMPKWAGAEVRFGLSKHLRMTIRPAFGDLLDDAEFAVAFERFEFLRSMMEADLDHEPALGEYASVMGRRPPSISVAIRREIRDAGSSWPLLRAGAFRGEVQRASDAADRAAGREPARPQQDDRAAVRKRVWR